MAVESVAVVTRQLDNVACQEHVFGWMQLYTVCIPNPPVSGCDEGTEELFRFRECGWRAGSSTDMWLPLEPLTQSVEEARTNGRK